MAKAQPKADAPIDPPVVEPTPEVKTQEGEAPAEEAGTQSEPVTEPKKLPGLRISSKVAGFRRAGRAWAATAEDVPLSAFSDEQIARLRAEVMLLVVDCDIDVVADIAE